VQTGDQVAGGATVGRVRPGRMRRHGGFGLGAWRLGCGWLAVCLLVAGPCRGAFLSEVYLSDGSAGGPPTSVEVSGLNDVAASSVELIVIDAVWGGRHGDVQRVVSVGTSSPVMLVSEGVWPVGLWDHTPAGVAANRKTVSETSGGDSFDLGFAATLLLYDRPTEVTEAGQVDLFSADQQAKLGDAVLLDSLTLGFAGVPVAADVHAPVRTVADGDVFVRPLDRDGAPLAWRTGEPGVSGDLAGVTPRLEVTPGWANTTWADTHPHPEPASAAVLALGALAVVTARPRRCRVKPR